MASNAETPTKQKKQSAKGRSKTAQIQDEQQAEVVEVQPETFAQAAALEDEDQPDVAENERIRRYDVLITSERPGYRPPKAAVSAMVQQIAFRGLAQPVDEAVAQTWAEIYFQPSVASHDIFLEKGGYDSSVPVFFELVYRFSEKAYFVEYAANPQRPLYWSIEIRGARYAQPIGAFRKLFAEAFNLRVESASRDFVALPPHLEVPEDEKPVVKKKRERGMGLAGTAVEEM
ncbi:MAG: hypothetical protein FWC40_08985 [Proteobacteria bacterium]|nr:hypothetical protein [Pseudomonadota bacterium]